MFNANTHAVEPSLTIAMDSINQAKVSSVKAPPFVRFPGKVTCARALIHSFMNCSNTNQVTANKFSEGCVLFGIESPTPTIKKRIAFYGNTNEVEFLLKQLFDE